jgi:phage tail tape measure protein, TP901 family, core region
MAQKLGDLVAVIGANTDPFNRALGEVNRNLNKSMGNIEKLGRNMSMAFTAPIALLAGKGVQVFRDFEFQMAKVKAVSGATGEEFASLETNAKELGATTRFTASEVAMLQTEYAKLGFSAQEITKVTGATLALAQASDSDLATAAEVAGSTLRAFGMDASETGRVTDVMASSFSSTALDMSSFAESMKFVAPVAKSAGMSIEETTALLGTLANAGIKGSNAGTALRRIISELGATGGDVSGALKELATQGLNLADAKDEVGRTAQSALLVLAEGTGTTDDLTKSLNNANGAAKRMADTMDATMEGSFKKMQSAVEGAQLAIGEALAPAVSQAADIIASAAMAFTNMSDSGQTVVMVMGGIAAAIGPAILVTGQMIRSYVLLKTTIVRGVIPALKRMIAAMVANPVLLLATAVTALGVALVAYTTQTTAAEKAAKALHDVQVTAAKSIAGEKVELEGLLRIARDETRSKEEREAAIKKLNAISPKYLGNLDLETINTDKAKTATTEYINELQRKAKVQAAQEKLVEIERQLLEVQSASTDQTFESMSIIDQQVALWSKWTGLKSKDAIIEEARTDQTKELNAQKEALIALLGEESSAVNNLNKSNSEQTSNTETQTDAIKSQTDAIKRRNAGMMEQIQSRGPSVIDTPDVGQLQLPPPEGAEDTIEALDGVKNKMNEVQSAGEQIGSALGSTFGQIIEGSASVEDVMKSAGKQILSTLINIAKANAIATFSSPTNPANAATGGLAMPAVIAGGLALVEGLLGAVAFADGGIVSGPTLGLVGEYSGARTNPEVIAPLDKLQGMLQNQGAQPMYLKTKLKGGDIEISAQSGRRKLNRTR